MPPKTTRKKANPKGSYVIYSNHTSIPEEKQVMQYITFDPGEDHFDIRIERRYMSQLSDYCARVKSVKYAQHKVEFQRKRKGKGTSSPSVLSIFAILDSYSKYMEDMDIAIIERQMDVNRNMMFLQTVIICYFTLKYPHIVTMDMSSKLKTKNFGAPSKLSYAKRKKFTGEVAIDLAERRGDKKFIKYIKKLEKSDDATDNYVMPEAFCVEVGYQLTK